MEESVEEVGPSGTAADEATSPGGGWRLPVPAPPGTVRTLTCPRCEAVHARDARFCPSCRSFLAAPDVGRLATPKRRLVAAVVDSVLRDGGLLGTALGSLVLGPFGRGLVPILSMAYWALTVFLWTKGTTPAKKALDMEVVTEDGDPPGFMRMALRETVGKWISWVVFGLGVLAIPFDKNHQGWHDKMFHTYVVHDDEP